MRATSNTPKSALTLLNDPSFVEAAHEFARQIVIEGGSTTRDRIVWAWQRAMTRIPDDAEIVFLENFIKSSANPISDKPSVEDVELERWLPVARTILNLHEFTTRN